MLNRELDNEVIFPFCIFFFFKAKCVRLKNIGRKMIL